MATSAATQATETAEHTIDTASVFGALGINLEGETQDEAPAAAMQEATATDAPAEATDITTADVNAAAKDQPDLFTDEALSTKEGIAAAREAVRQQNIKAQRVYHKTLRREKDAIESKRVHDHNAQIYNNLTQHQQRELYTLANGTTDEALAALGRLRQMDGSKAYEELTNTILANGKKPAAARDPRVDELGVKLDQLQAFLRGQSQEASVQRFTSAITTDISNIEAYPAIGHFVKVGKVTQTDVVKAVEDEVMQAKREGRPIPHYRALLKQFEANLKDLVPAAPPATPEKKALTGGRLPGKGAAPARVNAGTGTREMTEKERFDAAAQDPQFLASLGIVLE